MGIPKKYKAPFIENQLYHVYNRTNNKELLFINDDDRIIFLKKFEQYTAPFLDYFAWNLLENHFHFYTGVKSFEEIKDYLDSVDTKKMCLTEKRFLNLETTIHCLIDNIFKRFFISYTIYFNEKYSRKGNLFHRPFKHVVTDKESQFTQTIIYINANAVKHRLVNDINEHKWSSYHNIISDKPTILLKQKILDWFGGRHQFIQLHNEQIKYCYNCKTAIDDD